MAAVAFLALTLGLGFWILRPLLAPEDFRAEEYATSAELKDLLVMRDVAYDTLRDLEFDFRMGKMAEKDYQELKVRYQGEAAEILRQIETLEELRKGEDGHSRGRRPLEKATR